MSESGRKRDRRAALKEKERGTELPDSECEPVSEWPRHEMRKRRERDRENMAVCSVPSFGRRKTRPHSLPLSSDHTHKE